MIITMNSPLEAPSLKGRKAGAKTAAFVFGLRADAAVAAAAAPGATALAKQWLADAPDDPALSGRLKGIFHAEGAGVPRLALKWNGKPVLLAATASWGGQARPGISSFYKGADYVSVNVDVATSFSSLPAARHALGTDFDAPPPNEQERGRDPGRARRYMARGAIYLVQDKIASIDVRLGFVIEGRSDEELPEQLMCAVGVHQVDFKMGAPLEDVAPPLPEIPGAASPSKGSM